MQTRDLVPLVRAKGIEVGGKDAVATLSARLSNSAEFRMIRGRGWWFKDEPTPGLQDLHIDLDFEAADASPEEASPPPLSLAKEEAKMPPP